MEISIVRNTSTVEIAIKHFTSSFVGPRYIQAYIVTLFALE